MAVSERSPAATLLAVVALIVSTEAALRHLDGAWFEVFHVDSSHALLPHDRAFCRRLQEAA